MITEDGPADTSDPEAKAWTLEAVKIASDKPYSEMPRWHCQTGRGDICLAAQFGHLHIVCPPDLCDIDDGIRCLHLRAGNP